MNATRLQQRVVAKCGSVFTSSTRFIQANADQVICGNKWGANCVAVLPSTVLNTVRSALRDGYL